MTKDDLTKFPEKEYRFFAVATDNGVPKQSSSTSIVITVRKDEFAPVFQGGPYQSPQVQENRGVGSQIYSVRATDQDRQGSIRYEMLGDAPATDYFEVDKISGAIRIKAKLTEDISPFYIVRIAAYESNNPDRKTATTVRIPVLRNANGPKFERSEYERTIEESIQLGESVVQVRARDEDKEDIVTYSIAGNENDTPAKRYFGITGDSGVIYIKTLLSKDSSNSETFRVIKLKFSKHSKKNQISVLYLSV